MCEPKKRGKSTAFKLFAREDKYSMITRFNVFLQRQLKHKASYFLYVHKIFSKARVHLLSAIKVSSQFHSSFVNFINISTWMELLSLSQLHFSSFISSPPLALLVLYSFHMAFRDENFLFSIESFTIHDILALSLSLEFSKHCCTDIQM